MRQQFTREDLAELLPDEYADYQRLVREHGQDEHTVFNPRPAAIAHASRSLPILGTSLEAGIAGSKIQAAGILVKELVDRTKWLIGRGQVAMLNEPVDSRNHATAVILALHDIDTHNGMFAIVKQFRTPALGYPSGYLDPPMRRPITGLALEITGFSVREARNFSVIAAVGDRALSTANPVTPAQHLSGVSITEVFGYHDRITWVENQAPDAALPQQELPSHMQDAVLRYWTPNDVHSH